MSGSGSVASEERVFSLLLALAASEHGLTKQDILSTVHGYAQRYDDHSQRANMDRQFERDKEALRELGIPIETFEPFGEDGNNQQTRYRVPVEQLELDPSISFTARELALLRLSSFAWRESSLSGDARRAAMKLASLGHPLDTRLFAVTPTITTREVSFGQLADALAHDHVVEFSYQKPSSAAATLRRVAPLALERIDGRWHLISFDLARQENRVFLLSRIVGNVRETSEVFSRQLLERVPQILEEIAALRNRQVAVISRKPNTEAFVRLPERIHFLDEDVLAEELVAFGGDVVVVSPETLRNKVIDLLTLIRDLHSDSGAGV